jgi:hypothetical protein
MDAHNGTVARLLRAVRSVVEIASISVTTPSASLVLMYSPGDKAHE